MAFLKLNLYRHPSGAVLDPSSAIEKAKAWFPEAEFLPGDQLALEAERAEGFLAKELREDPHGPARKVVDSLRRKAAVYGPALTFRIPRRGHKPILGTARRYGVFFLFDEPLADDVRNRLFEFLRSFGVGRIETCVAGERSLTVLLDMPGGPENSASRPATSAAGAS